METRQSGSHKVFTRISDNKTTVVPVHPHDIGKGLLRSILREIGLSPDEFIKELRK